MNKLKKFLFLIFDLVSASMVVVVMAYAMGHLTTDFPAGVDAYAYLTRIRIILDWFPNINWNPFWDSGVPFWLWSHPPLSMLIATVSVKLLGMTPEASLIWLALLSFIIFAIGIYGFVNNAVENRVISIFAVVFMLASPASWGWWNGGNYTRVFGLGFLGLGMFFVSGYLKNLLSKNRKKTNLYYVGVVISTGFAYMSHLLNGGYMAVVTILLVFFTVNGFKSKVKESLKLILPGILLSSYWYVPLFLTGNSGSRFFGKNSADPIPLGYLWNPIEDRDWNFALIPVYLMVFVPTVLLFLGSFYSKLRKNVGGFTLGVCMAMMIFSLGNFIYNFVGHLPFYPDKYYINGYPPTSAFPAFAIFWGISIAICTGIVLRMFLKNKILTSVFSAVLLAFLISQIVFSFRFFTKASLYYVAGDESSLNYMTQQAVEVQESINQRFGTDSSFVADWFNYKHALPQTRDYFSQGIPYPDWISWFEKSVWYDEKNMAETNFLLDWYAVKRFFVGEPHFKNYKFDGIEGYEVVRNETLRHSWGHLPFYTFEYEKSGPILASTNASAVLVIGKDYDYDVLFRALALTGMDSHRIIPVKGRELVDLYSLGELQKFEGVVLYNYGYRNVTRAHEMLGEYVKNGGSLWVEAANSPENVSSDLPQVFPVTETFEESITGWQMRPGEALPKGIDIGQIPPPSYEGAAWKAVFGKSPRSWAESVLTSAKGELFVTGNYGKGKVVWTGMNFPYHLSIDKNEEEARLFSDIIVNWVDTEDREFAGSATFINPQLREIILDASAKGVLFKETFHRNWDAYAWIGGNKVKLHIERAGPDLMYVPVPEKTERVVFKYTTSWIEKLGWFITFVTLGWLIYYFVHTIGKTEESGDVLSKYKGKLTSWWDEY